MNANRWVTNLAIGEMHYIPMGPNSTVSLPRKGGVAYHAQESWVLNETIRVHLASSLMITLADGLCSTEQYSVWVSL